MGKRFFEDLTEGEPLACRPVVLTRESIVAFAQQFDPQPFHLDEDAAARSLFGGLVASSLHTLAACTRVVVEAQGGMAILSGVAVHEVEMFNPVRPGDTLCVDARWENLRLSRSKPDRGFASIHCKVSNQHKDPVVAYGYRYLIACRKYPIKSHHP